MTDFEKKDGFIWMDGEFVDWSQAKVHVLTHTLHYGLGVFEGVRAYLTDQGTKIFSLEIILIVYLSLLMPLIWKSHFQEKSSTKFKKRFLR